MLKFLNGIDDVEWLKETHLKGFDLPPAFKDFQSFVLLGNEDAPEAITLFKAKDPVITEGGFYIDPILDFSYEISSYGGEATPITEMVKQ